jgi:hypothetical protein
MDRYAEYEYLRGDRVGALEQVSAEIRTALSLNAEEQHPALKWPRSVVVLLEGLEVKCELGLDPNAPDPAPA